MILYKPCIDSMCSVSITLDVLQVNAEANIMSTGYEHQHKIETHLISKDEVMSKITLKLMETGNQVYRCEFILSDQTVHSEGTQGMGTPAENS